MSTARYTRRSALALGGAFVAALAGCTGVEGNVSGGGWKTDYTPIPELAANWRLSSVSVAVPKSLIVSEDNSVYVPAADIVWQEEPFGDRHEQVRAIVTEGIRGGARGLKGSTPVRIEAQVTKFHALNRKTLYNAPVSTGVENIVFSARVVHARSGAVLLEPVMIYAEFPGLVGGAYQNALAQGQTERMRIVSHINRTTAGWLGIGPDNRTTFNRRGG